MRVQFSFVGLVERPAPIFCDMDTVPREGESVCFPEVSKEQDHFRVRTVVWYPKGADGEGPFVYVVLGA